jgi:hypothetical protein
MLKVLPSHTQTPQMHIAIAKEFALLGVFEVALIPICCHCIADHQSVPLHNSLDAV